MEGSKIAQDKVLIERFSFSVEAPAGSFISHLSGVFSYLGLFFKWIQVMAWFVHELFFFFLDLLNGLMMWVLFIFRVWVLFLQNCAVTGINLWVISINLIQILMLLLFVVGGVLIFYSVIGFLQLEVRFFYYS